MPEDFYHRGASLELCHERRAQLALLSRRRPTEAVAYEDWRRMGPAERRDFLAEVLQKGGKERVLFL